MGNKKNPTDHLGRPIYDRYGLVIDYNAWPTDEYGRPVPSREQLISQSARKEEAAHERAARRAAFREYVNKLRNNRLKSKGKDLVR